MLSLKQLKDYTKGNILNGNINTIFYDFSTSKVIPNLKDYFFIPFIFKGINREIYILEHVKNGCAGFMINKNSKNKDEIINQALHFNKNICILEVESVNDSLFTLGKIWREKNINKPVIAVAGSYGKTTLCSLISKILSTQFNVLHDFKNQNNNTVSLISLTYLYFDNYDMAVTEVGISRSGIMSSLSELTKPSIAIINSIGTAHIENLKSKENVLEEKMHITDYLKDKKILYINSDDEYLQTVQESDNYKLEKYSINEAWNIKEHDDGISFTSKIYNKDTDFNLELYSTYHIRNIILAIKVAERYNIKYENIVKAINEFKPVHGRFKVLKNKISNITLIDDTYNSCFESALNGLKTASKMKSNRKIAVLGPIGAGPNGKDDTDKINEEFGRCFKDLNFDYLYLTGDYTKHIFKGALTALPEKNIKKFKTKELLLEELEKNIEDGDLIFIKDAGLQGFEEIVYKLKEKYNLS